MVNTANSPNALPVQASNIKKSAQDAIKKSLLVQKETGVAPDPAGLAALQALVDGKK